MHHESFKYQNTCKDIAIARMSEIKFASIENKINEKCELYTIILYMPTCMDGVNKTII